MSNDIKNLIDINNENSQSDNTETINISEDISDSNNADVETDIPETISVYNEVENNRTDYEYEQIDFDALMKSKKFSLFLKRSFDVFASALGLLILSPILIIVSMLILFTSNGGVFFRQIRVGKNGKEFKIFKFRTMIVNAESKGMQITVGADKRITKVGKILRKTKIDELPQLINVFVGQMSFVGYRPEVPRYVAMYTDYERNVLRIKPGITDLASITYRDENEVLDNSENPEYTYINEIMPTKLALNMEYMKKMGFWYDIGLIFKTFLAILK